MIAPFSIARLPRIEFGSGAIARIPDLARGYGQRALLITGSGAIERAPQWRALLSGLQQAGVSWERLRVRGEPSPELVDRAVAEFGPGRFDLVIGLGGGSVLDAAKAIAGLLPHGNSVMDHLEGAGPEQPYRGPSLPFIAAPTTAGTGSEATKNAVLSRRGAAGFKKSFRGEPLVPAYAVVDPDLLATCPPAQIAANGMDALTQLMESYVSTRANAFTDALALSGCCRGTSRTSMAPRPAAAWPTPRCSRASAWPRPGSAPCTDWHRRWAPFTRSPMAWSAALW